ncbi:MAG: heparinase II/III family protein [Planctomycetota bacterium]
MMTRKKALACIVFILSLIASGLVVGQEGQAITVRQGHPRLVADESTWATLRAHRERGDELGRLVAWLESEAVAMLEEEPLQREMQGIRLLTTSRRAMYRLSTLSLAYRTSGDARLLERAKAELDAVLSFKDWNPGHYLDTAEIAVGVALAYDWLHDELPPKLRDRIRDVLIERVLRDVTSETPPGHLWWMQSPINWNSVCFAAVTLSALVVADHEPELATEAIEIVRRLNPRAMKVYAPDGVYAEGSSYWNYGTTFQVLLIDALQTAIGHSFDIEGASGFMQTGKFLGYITGPSGKPFNFSDARPFSQPQPALLWFAEKTGDASLIETQIDFPWHDYSEVFVRQVPLGAVWWSRIGGQDASKSMPPMAWRGRGKQPLAIFRGAPDSQQWFLATKGGSASISHGHMDAGSFVLEAMGQRWAVDLGMQTYHTLESHGLKLFEGGQDGDRWKVFSNNQLSHNTLTINGEPHRINGHAPLIEFNAESQVASATYDLTKVLGDGVGRAIRTFRFGRDRERVRIVDTLTGVRPGARVRWAMLTPAAVELDGSSCVLELDSRRLIVESTTSPRADFATIDPQTLMAAYDAPNPGLTLLVLEVEAPASGRVDLDVGFESAR